MSVSVSLPSTDQDWKFTKSILMSNLPQTLLITECSFIINVHLRLHSNRIKAQLVEYAVFCLFLIHATINYLQVNIQPSIYSGVLFTLLIGSYVIGQLPGEDVLIRH